MVIKIAKTWTIEVGGVARNYRRVRFQRKLKTNKPATFSGTVEYNAGIDYWDLVEIKRDGTVEFKGFVEIIDVKWDENGRYLYIAGRDTKVIVWKKYSDNFSNMHEDTKGFFGRVKAQDLITFLLRTPKSDFDPNAFPNNKEGWGIDVSKFTDFTASRTSVGDPNYTKLRRRGYGWRNSGNPFASEQDVVDAEISRVNWTAHGVGPYLHDDDNNNYIESNTDNATAIYSFADLPANTTSIEMVHLTVVWKPDKTWWFWINSECDVYISPDGGSSWTYVGVFGGRESPIKPNPWRHFTFDISYLIKTVSQVNNCRIKLVNKSTALTTNITQAYLSVGYTTGGTQETYDLFDIPFATETIVGMYVESRMDDESYPRDYKIMTVTKPKEDFSIYTEEDPNGHITVVGTDHIDFEAHQSEDAWLRYDYGANYFGTYFKHTFDVQVVTDPVPEDGIMGSVWALTNDLDDIHGLINGNKDFVSLYVWRDPTDIINGGGPCFVLREQDGAGATTSISAELTEGTTYSVEIVRVGASLTAIIHVGSTLFATLSITLSGGNSYRYLMPAITAHDGADSLLSSYSETNDDGAQLLLGVHPSADADVSASGQCFPITPAFNARLTSCKFNMAKIGAPVGVLRAGLYEITGTIGVDAKPTGSELATSNDVAMASLNPVARQLVTFTFPFPYYMMDHNKDYCIVVYVYSATTLDGANYVSVGHDTSAPSHVGNRAFYNNSAWTGDNTRDVCFYVYGRYDVFTDINIDDLVTEVETTLASVSSNTYRDIIHSWTPQSMDHLRIRLTGQDLNHSWAISQIYLYKAESCDYRVYKETGCTPTYAANQYISALAFDSAYTTALGPLNLPRARLIDILNTVVKQCHSAYVPYEWWLALDANNTFHFKNQKGGSPAVTFAKGTNLGKVTRTKEVSDTVQRVRVIGRGEGKRQEDVSSDWVEDVTAMGTVNSFYEDIVSKKSMVDKTMSDLVANIHLSDEADPKDQPIITVNNDSYASMAYDTGDNITVTDSLTGTSGSHRIYNITKEVDGDGEVITIAVDAPERDDADEWAELYKRLKELEVGGVTAADWTGEADEESKVAVEVVTDFFEKTAKNDEDFSKKDITDPSWYMSPNPTGYTANQDAVGAGGPRGLPAHYDFTNGRRWTHENEWMKLTGPNSGNATQTLLVELRGDTGEEIEVYMRQNPKLVFEMKIFEDVGTPVQWRAGDFCDIGLANHTTDKGYFFRIKAEGGAVFKIYACWNETGTPADTQERLIRTLTRNIKYRLEIITEDANRFVIFNVYDVDQEQKYPPSIIKTNMDRDIIVYPLYMYLSAHDDNSNPNIRATVYVYKFKTEWEKVR